MIFVIWISVDHLSTQISANVARWCYKWTRLDGSPGGKLQCIADTVAPIRMRYWNWNWNGNNFQIYITSISAFFQLCLLLEPWPGGHNWLLTRAEIFYPFSGLEWGESGGWSDREARRCMRSRDISCHSYLLPFDLSFSDPASVRIQKRATKCFCVKW